MVSPFQKVMRGLAGFTLMTFLAAAGQAQAQSTVLSVDGKDFQTKTTGGQVSGTNDWIVWSNGYVETTLNFPSSGNYQFQVQAYADLAQSLGANMEVRVDQNLVKSFTVANTSSQTYSVTAAVSAGSHKIEIAFTNDYYANGEDRNLYVRHLNVISTAVAQQTTALPLSNANLTAQPGQVLNFTTQFNAVPMDKNYVVFVHFVNSNGNNAFGADYSPTPATTQWSGPISAARTVTVPASLPKGTYSIKLGLYENVSPYTNRAKLAAGPGVTEDNQLRYTVGTLTVGATAPAPAPVPAPTTPVPAPVPAPAPTTTTTTTTTSTTTTTLPAPVATPTPSYALTIATPASAISGTVQVKGTGPGFLNVEMFGPNGSLLARTTPDSSGNFTATVDTTKLTNGSQTWTIDAWDSPAGQNFSHTAEKKITVTVQNAVSTPAPAPTPTPAPVSGSVPVGGPSGYSKMVMNDSFGSSKTGANITALSQFNQGTYGSNGFGWDDHMCAWDCGKANLSMAADHLEIRPTGGPSGFISSRYEFLPTGSQRIYYEIRMTAGRGTFSPQTWPAIWLFAGNEPGSNNAQSEFDIMETYMDQWDATGNPNSGYPYHFAITVHDNANASSEFKLIDTPSIDVTTTYNVYGCEVYRGANGNLQYNVYFNGKLVYSTSTGLTWRSSPPSLFIGWNPGKTSWSPAVINLDYVRAWVK